LKQHNSVILRCISTKFGDTKVTPVTFVDILAVCANYA